MQLIVIALTLPAAAQDCRLRAVVPADDALLAPLHTGAGEVHIGRGSLVWLLPEKDCEQGLGARVVSSHPWYRLPDTTLATPGQGPQ